MSFIFPVGGVFIGFWDNKAMWVVGVAFLVVMVV